MKKSLLIMMLLATICVARGQTYSYRYWLDKDFATVQSGSCTSGGAEFDIDLSSLSAGIHAVHVQACDENGNWGSAWTRFFFRAPEASHIAVKGRYWFDNKISTLHEDVAAEGLIDIDISSLSSGLHIIHYQAQNANGDYSPVRSCFFSIPNTTKAVAVKGRYWFDNDISTIHEDIAAEGLIDIDVSALSDGLHMIHYQTQNAAGDYSPVNSRFFSVVRPALGDAKSVKVWINDTEPTEYDLPEDELLIDVSNLPTGTHDLHVVLLDVNGLVIDEVTQQFEITSPVITFTDPAVKAICVANWDTNGDGELSEDEAAAVTSLNEAFSNNREITSFDELRYFTGLTAVSDMDFFFCTSLVSMTLPKNLADVPETTFKGCESLTNLKAAEGNEYYCTVDGLLYDKNVTLLLFCPPKKAGTVVVPATVKRIGTNGFYECAELTAITLPDKLEELGDAVFVGCMKLTNIHIPASVKIMGLGLVSACTNLESITVDEANAYFQSIDGVLYTKSDLILMSYPNKKGKEYVVQDGTKGIDAYSFCYTEIEKVTLPASIKVIGYLAFGYCKNLKTIVSLNPAPTAAGIRPDIMNDDEYEGITLMVPYGSKSLYEASNGWNMFTNIVEMPDANAITITADNLTMEYGDAVPELTYKVQGGVLEGTPVLSCEATSTSPVGTYDIIVCKGTVKNENVTYVAGKLTINQAPLTISAGTYTKKQYDPMPEIVLTYNGFKNEETATVLTKQVVISCAANEESVPGEYAITLSGAEATNYDISYVAGKLIVTEPDSFTLAYIVDGELYRSFIVKYKEAITPLEEPTKEGYTFSGWSEIPETMPAHDVTVTGTFTQETGIEQIMNDENGKAMIYTIDGKRVDNPKKGMNVIRMKDGTTRKVVVK